MQFGSSSQAVFFKMRVAGQLHIFQFETRQGEDICMALQTHINDIMMKRYNKVRGRAAAAATLWLQGSSMLLQMSWVATQCMAYAGPACSRLVMRPATLSLAACA